MSTPDASPRKAGTVWFVLGAIAVVLFLVGLIRLPGALASGDGAFTAGAVVGVLIWAVAAVLLFLRGVKVRRG